MTKLRLLIFTALLALTVGGTGITIDALAGGRKSPIKTTKSNVYSAGSQSAVVSENHDAPQSDPSVPLSAEREAAPAPQEQALSPVPEGVTTIEVADPDLSPVLTAPTTFAIPWQAVSAGGEFSTSTNYESQSTLGQSATGPSASTNYNVGVGFWYGAFAGGGGGCACDCFADPQCDGLTNVLDVVHAVNIAFKGAPAISDPNPSCPRTRTDVDCTGLTNVLDVVRFVNVAFKGFTAASQFCDPCP